MSVLNQLKPNDSGDQKPLLCLEINPPRGSEVEGVLKRFATVPGLDFVNVTDSALAKMRMSGLMFASLLKQRLKIEPLVNLACRDRNSIALQSDLLGAWALGIRSVIALTGDAVTVGDLPDAKGVFEVNSIGLLNLIGSLNRGQDLAGVSLKGDTNFIPGVVVNPNVRNRDAELRRLAKKRDAGAIYALSQPVFDPEQAAEFFRAASDLGIHLFVGVMPFKSARTLDSILKVPGIKMPERILEAVRAAPEEEVPEISLQLALEVANSVKGHVRGVHVVSGGAPLLALTLCERLVSWIQENFKEVHYEASGRDDVSRAGVCR